MKLDALPGAFEGFVGDPPEGTFSNNERALYVTSTLWTDYQRAAGDARHADCRQRLQAITRVTGRHHRTPRRSFAPSGAGSSAARASTTEEQKYQALFTSGPSLVASGDAFADGVRMVIGAMLQSPNFVYRSELGTDGAPLSGYEMASKLSFLLRNTTPDDALLDAAAAGELGHVERRHFRATAMLEEDSAQVVVGRFITPSSSASIATRRSTRTGTTFPTYDPALNPELVEDELQLFFDRIFSTGQGMRGISSSSTLAFVNSASAGFYGVSASGQGLTEVELGPERPHSDPASDFSAQNATLN